MFVSAASVLRVQLDHLLVVVRALQQLDPRVERPTLSGEEDLPGRKRAVVAQAAEQAPAASPLPPRGCTLSTNSVAPFSSRPPSEQAACTLSTLARTGKVRTLLPCTLTAEQMQSEEGGAEAAAATQAEKGYLQTQRERCRGRGRRGAGAVEGVCSGDAYSIGPRLRTPSELGPRGVSIVARKGRSRASSAYTRTCEGARRFRAWGCASEEECTTCVVGDVCAMDSEVVCLGWGVQPCKVRSSGRARARGRRPEGGRPT